MPASIVKFLNWCVILFLSTHCATDPGTSTPVGGAATTRFTYAGGDVSVIVNYQDREIRAAVVLFDTNLATGQRSQATEIETGVTIRFPDELTIDVPNCDTGASLESTDSYSTYKVFHYSYPSTCTAPVQNPAVEAVVYVDLGGSPTRTIGASSVTTSSGGSSVSVVWGQEAYVKAKNNDTADYSGRSVAVSGDTMVVGAQYEDSNQTTITNGTTASSNNSATDAGAVYVYKRTGATWVQEAYLKAPNAEAGDEFGVSVAIDGDTIVVGAYGEDSNQATVTNGATASGNNTNTDSGAAYVFKRTGTTWAQEAYLKAPNSDSNDLFGASVSISSDTIVVGALNESSNQITITNGNTASGNNSASSAGAAYVFKRSGVNWAQEAYLKAPNSQAADAFGASVGVQGDTIVVGAETESSSQATITNGSTASGDNSASGAGAAYVFKRSGVNWSQEAYLKAPNAQTLDSFGGSVAVDGDTILVGAYAEDSNQTTVTNGTTASSDNSADGAGAAYVFKRTGTNWAQEAYLKAPNAAAQDRFGYYFGLAISGDRIVVGAYGEDSNQTTVTNGTTASSNNSADGAGAAYVFKRTGTNWAQEAYLKAKNSGASDNYGYGVAIDDDTIVIGASGESSNQTTITNGNTASSNNSSTESGAVYIYNAQ